MVIHAEELTHNSSVHKHKPNLIQSLLSSRHQRWFWVLHSVSFLLHCTVLLASQEIQLPTSPTARCGVNMSCVCLCGRECLCVCVTLSFYEVYCLLFPPWEPDMDLLLFHCDNKWKWFFFFLTDSRVRESVIIRRQRLTQGDKVDNTAVVRMCICPEPITHVLKHLSTASKDQSTG